MSERPILFSGPMVKAILDGRKTQTRRVLKPQPLPGWELQGFNTFGQALFYPPDSVGLGGGLLAAYEKWDGLGKLPYAVGDVLYVRETWATVNAECGPGWAYRADGAFDQPKYDGEDFGAGPSFNYDKYPGDYCMWYGDLIRDEPDHKWTPSIHMPKWAARIWLEVTNVRVQRVQSISEADAVAEGIERVGGGRYWLGCTGTDPHGNPQVAFQRLWDSLNAKRGYGWDVNPWVAAYTFKRIEKPS